MTTSSKVNPIMALEKLAQAAVSVANPYANINYRLVGTHCDADVNESNYAFNHNLRKELDDIVGIYKAYGMGAAIVHALVQKQCEYVCLWMHDLSMLRRIADYVYLNNYSASGLWRKTAEIQIGIRMRNPDQHVGYVSQEDLRGLAATISRQITHRTSDFEAIKAVFDGMIAAYV